ncbi:MAG: hypothetical protein AAGH15_17010, partial [Myxococcota bacterium]
AVLVGAGVASAQDAGTLHRSRHALRTYDLEGSGSTDVLRALGGFVASQPEGPLRREGRFLRTVAAADLVLLSDHHGTPELVGRVAEAYGVAPQALLWQLDADLEAIAIGIYAPVAEDARHALQRLAGTATGDRPEGARGDLLRLAEIRQAASAREPLAALAAIGEDPCPEGDCDDDVYAHFDASGRKAVAATAEIAAIVLRLRAQAPVDPFAAAVLLDVDQDLEAVIGLELHPTPSLGAELHLAHAVDAAAPVDVDVVIAAQSDEVRFGFVPHVRFDAIGRPELIARGEPILPHTQSVALPRTLRPFPGALDALVEALRRAVPEDAIVALGTTCEAPAHLVTRAWISAETAERTPRFFVGADDADTLRGVAMDGRHGASDAMNQLFVRLGGHSLKRRGGATFDIPRVRGDDGALRFDYATLDARVASDRTTSLRYMSSLDGQSLTTTVFLAAPADGPIVLELP